MHKAFKKLIKQKGITAYRVSIDTGISQSALVSYGRLWSVLWQIGQLQFFKTCGHWYAVEIYNKLETTEVS